MLGKAFTWQLSTFSNQASEEREREREREKERERERSLLTINR
jgi:hypothetical protein